MRYSLDEKKKRKGKPQIKKKSIKYLAMMFLMFRSDLIFADTSEILNHTNSLYHDGSHFVTMMVNCMGFTNLPFKRDLFRSHTHISMGVNRMGEEESDQNCESEGKLHVFSVVTEQTRLSYLRTVSVDNKISHKGMISALYIPSSWERKVCIY